jgi:acyl dehydratase
MADTQQMTYAVEAYNVSHASENKIHDDSVAKKLGFTGGLVPGVEVYAYMTHLALERYGRAWLEHGQLDCRFYKPVYDGRIATVTATEADGKLALKVGSEGIDCAAGTASLGNAQHAAPSINNWEARTPPAERPPADERSLATGTWLGTQPACLTAEQASTYLGDVRETAAVYRDEQIAHPGILLRLMNSVLKDNVVLAPWIHTGSVVRNFAVAHVGDVLSARARIINNYERKGHRLVDLDGIVIANGDTVVAHVLHTAVYQLRHLGAA